MILNSMTTPSAWRSLHHCSPRSEKMQRAEDKLITLLTKVCRPVSLSVMLEQGDLFLISLIHESQTSGKSVSENEQIRILLERHKEQILADCQSRDSKTRVASRLRQKKYPKIEWSYRVSTRMRSIVLFQETNNFDEINNFFMNNYWNKIGIFVKLMRKVSKRWKN